jgi:ribosomal protein S12 methylthiotransferase accessory factor
MVSGYMEAIELFHAECEPLVSRSAAAVELRRADEAWLPPQLLHGFNGLPGTSDERRIEWILGTDLATDKGVWVPAGAVHFHREPTLHFTTTNGLASGNHLIEASLHALYELVERDATARLLGNARVRVEQQCQVIDRKSITGGRLQQVLQRFDESASKLVLMRIPSSAKVHTFWAVLMDANSRISGSTFNTGWGTHHELEVAALRAVTEAAQSRATMIHGSREDALTRPVYGSGSVARESHAYTVMRGVRPNTSWAELGELGISSSSDLGIDFSNLVHDLYRSGHGPLIRCDLSRPDLGIAVVKILAPQLRFRYR